MLPDKCSIESIAPHGESFWAKIGRIDTELQDGSPASFFIKVLSGETGKAMIHGEYESITAIHKIQASFVPKPLGCGSFETMPNAHFLLCEFREMNGNLPNAREFSSRLATLHKDSRSPNGMFGFHLTTYAGNLPQAVEWEASWETFFANSLRKALDLEIAAKGSDPELDRLLPVIFERVIPRLLRPLESEGRSVKPSLVHGDLWFANSGIDNSTGESLIFDACSFYAHNECNYWVLNKKAVSYGELLTIAY